jgi:hypothetical protein
MVRLYNEMSCETILCTYIKRLIDNEFKIKYPNRNTYINMLFGAIGAIEQMNDFVVVKIDFKDYFNSVSSKYVYKKFVEQSNISRDGRDIMLDYVDNNEYCYAGLSASNAMAEIIAKEFDREISKKFIKHGVVFYKRYVDDCLLILNKYIDECEVIKLINEIIKAVYSDSTIDAPRCKVAINSSKFNYIARRKINDTSKPMVFNFLGYEFVAKMNGGKLKFKYGITKDKIDKYRKQIENIVAEYTETNNTNVLRHRLKTYCARVVYRIKRYKTMIWKSKGFISNYNELKNHMEELTTETSEFLKNAVVDAFNERGCKIPFFLKNREEETPFSLFNGLRKNRAIILDQTIGLNLKAIRNLCREVGITSVGKYSYDRCVREYLITMKLRH